MDKNSEIVGQEKASEDKKSDGLGRKQQQIQDDLQPCTSAQAQQQHLLQQQQVAAEAFFDGKLRLHSEINLQQLQADVLVNFCASDILSGDEIFLNVHELAGTELKNFCAQYQSMGIGNCRLSDSYGLTNFKKIAHTILPRPVQGDEQLIDLDELVEFDLMLCYRNALDATINDGHSSVVFTHPLLYGDRYGVAKLAVAVLTYWLDNSPIAHKLEFAAIACPNEEIAQCYMELVAELLQRGWADFVSSHSSALYSYLVDSFETGNKFEEAMEQVQNRRENGGAGAEEPSNRRPYCVGGIGQRSKGMAPKPLVEYDQMQADLQMLDTVFEREFPLMLMDPNYPEQYMGGVDEDPFLSEEQQTLKRQGAKRRFEDSDLAVHPPELIHPPPQTFLPIMDGHPNLNQFCLERYGFDEQYIRDYPDEVYDMLFRSPEGLQLQLSRNLSATILTLEEEHGGMVRQYRMTTQNREGETLYFRCSRCESLMRYTNDEYRPKLTVKDGFIQGDCFPAHHPQCYPVTKEWVIIQQLDRQARLQMVQLDAMTQWGIPASTGQMPLDATASMPAAATMAYDGGLQPQKRNRYSAVRHAEMTAPMEVTESDATVSEALSTAIKEELGARTVPDTTSARTRLRPAREATLQEPPGQRRNGPHQQRKPMSVTTPRYALSAPTNPSEVPILYRRREAPDNSTLRAIRNCESELEGKVSEELEMALAAEENMFWNAASTAGGGMRIALPLSRSRRHYVVPPYQFFQTAAEHEEVVTDVANMGDDRPITAERPDEHHMEQEQSERMPNGGGPTTEKDSHPADQAQKAVTSVDEEENEDKSGKKFRKYRVISKRGTPRMAFDWRETDLE